MRIWLACDEMHWKLVLSGATPHAARREHCRRECPTRPAATRNRPNSRSSTPPRVRLRPTRPEEPDLMSSVPSPLLSLFLITHCQPNIIKSPSLPAKGAEPCRQGRSVAICRAHSKSPSKAPLRSKYASFLMRALIPLQPVPLELVPFTREIGSELTKSFLHHRMRRPRRNTSSTSSSQLTRVMPASARCFARCNTGCETLHGPSFSKVCSPCIS